MKKIALILLWFISICIVGFASWYFAKNGTSNITSKAPQQIAEKVRKYDKYSYDALSGRQFSQGQIKFEEVIQEFPEYTAWKISFKTDGDKQSLTSYKRVEGQVNIPKSEKPANGYPTILMIRGSADVDGYRTGNGTRNAASYFAKQGFLTVAPDFLGYGGSDPINSDILEARFETYTTVLNLIASLPSIPQADTSKLGMWAHSNGGHIANAMLEITGRTIPTALWAPVTKPFPYSVLVYTDDSPDHGKVLIETMSDFMKDYDINKYSIDSYFDRINSPIQLHQGTADVLIRKDWSDQYVKALKDLKKDIRYIVHPGADHNLQPGTNWNEAIKEDVEFFQRYLLR